MIKENNCQPRIAFPAELPFKNKNLKNIFSDMQSLRKLMSETCSTSDVYSSGKRKVENIIETK